MKLASLAVPFACALVATTLSSAPPIARADLPPPPLAPAELPPTAE